MASNRSVERYNVQGEVSPYMAKYQEAASASWGVHELVYGVAGQMTVVASNGVTVFAMAEQAGSGVTAAEKLFSLIFETDLLLVSVTHATPASAITAVADLHKKMSIERDATNKWHMIGIDDASNDAWVPIGIAEPNINPAGTQYGRYIVKVLPAAIQTGAAAT